MPLQELAPPPPVTGFSSLGNALAGGANDYRLRQQQLQDEARSRSQQLEDVASQRDWLQREGDTTRAEELKKQEDLTKFQNEEAGKTLLVNEGLLDGGKRDDPTAVSVARARFVAEGLDKIYNELFITPDENTGKPLLTHADATNPALVQAAKDKLSALKAKQLQFQLMQPGNADAYLNQKNGELVASQKREQQIVSQLNQPPRQFGPNDQETMALATQLAEQIKPGSGQDKRAVMAQISTAQQQLNNQELLNRRDRIASAHQQIEAERYNQASITQAIDKAVQIFRQAPSGARAAPPSDTASLLNPNSAPSPQVAPQGSPSDFLSKFKAIQAQPTAAAVPPPAPDNSIVIPDNAPPEVATAMRSAQADQMSAQRKATIDDPLASTQAQIAQIDQQLKNMSAIGGPVITGGGGFGAPPGIYSNVDNAKAMSTLLQQKAALQQKADQLKAAQGSGVSGDVTPGGASTPVSFTPASFSAPSLTSPQWWQASQAAPAM